MRLNLVNVDRVQSAAFGGMPSVYDLCYVYDLDEPGVFHAHKLAYSGELFRAHAFKRQAESVGAVNKDAFDAARTAVEAAS